MTRPVCLFTDFGLQGPYVGQMKAALMKAGAGPIIDLMADAPSFDPRASAYLLAALLPYTPDDCVLLGVVDPGVGSHRLPLMARVDGRFLVGPDNGLFAPCLKRAVDWRCWSIARVPADAAPTFHGRDLFAPVAAALSCGVVVESLAGPPAVPVGLDWPDDPAQVIYVDHYGNVMTGLRGSMVTPGRVFQVGGHSLSQARTFAEVAPGQAFWYVNSIGLVEFAVNQGSAGCVLGLKIGDSIG